MGNYPKKLESIFAEFTKIIDLVIKQILVSDVEKRFQKIVEYQISTRGKRLRPVLAVISCRMLGGKFANVLWPASGLEILHNYTLIVDDIIDNSRKRRGKPTVWAKFGRSVAQCIGMYYSAAVFQAAQKAGNSINKVAEVFAKTLKTIIDGEILDILFEQSGRRHEPYIAKNRHYSITEKDYFNMAGKKTASLFQTSCEVGGISAGANKKELSVLRNYGFNLGLAFQITDDILDIFGKEKEFGKVIGGDIAERKLGNIVMLYALKELKPTDKKRLLAILRKEKIKKEDIKKAVKIIKKTNSRQKAELLAKKFIEKAKRSLAPLPQNNWNRLLGDIADFVVARKT